MKENTRTNPRRGAGTRDLRRLVAAAMLAALSIVLGKFAAINITNDIRLSFENLPLIFASVTLGPLWGMGVGIAADLLGCVLRGYSPIPLVTVAQALIGLIPGLLTRFVFRRTTAPTVAISAAITHIVCSMFFKTYALCAWYGQPFLARFPWRVLTYVIIGAIEAYLCATLLRVGAIRREFGLPERSGSEKKTVHAQKKKRGKNDDSGDLFAPRKKKSRRERMKTNRKNSKRVRRAARKGGAR